MIGFSSREGTDNIELGSQVHAVRIIQEILLKCIGVFFIIKYRPGEYNIIDRLNVSACDIIYDIPYIIIEIISNDIYKVFS